MCKYLMEKQNTETVKSKQVHTINAIIVDDHEMVAKAIAMVVSEIANIQVLGIANDTKAAIDLIDKHAPKLMLLDLIIADDNYEELANYFVKQCPHSKIIIVSGIADNFTVPIYIRDHVIAVIDKSKPWNSLISALERIKKESECTSENEINKYDLQTIEAFPERIKKVFNEICKGSNNKEISRELGLSKSTVESYRKHICMKLEISGSQLVHLATLYRALYWFHSD